MYRRTLLASLQVGAVSTVAGCSDWTTSYHSVSLDPVDHAEIADDATKTAADLVPSLLIDDLIATILEGDAVELETITELKILTDPSSNDGSFYYRDESSVYEISRERLTAGGITGPEYRASRKTKLPDDVSPTEEDEVLPFADLPAHDQWRIHETFEFYEGRLISFENTTTVGYLESDRETDSRLFGGIRQRFLEYNGKYIELAKLKEGTAVAEHVRVSAEQIASNEKAFAEHLLDRHAVDATSLNEDTRELLNEVQENGGSISASDEDDGFEERETVLAQLQAERREMDMPIAGENEMYILYEDDYYRFHWSSHTAP
ncbi:hypothetical protein ACFR99_01210 [Haloarchaeobius amylolyticus]|uniref:Lipoprotein n=1 Tax=Haloarchaeobius amylolyticus TaxID=1198296 RepID=A0ABD6BBQ3_9EURY